MSAEHPARSTPRDNGLLAALPEEVFAALMPYLEPVPLPLGTALYESGGVQGYLYFPTSGIVSLLYVLENGSSAEIAIAGKEGLVGISLFMGGETTPSRAVVQSTGQGYRIRAAVLKKIFENGSALQHVLLRYTQALITDDADGGLQPPPLGRPAALPLAAAQPRPAAFQ